MAKFVKGQSGNPSGRPKEISDVRKALQIKIADEGDKIIEAALKMANDGNETMIKFFAERLIPKQIEGYKAFNANNDAKTLINNSLQQYADGEISGEGLSDITGAIQKRVNIVELMEMKSKIDALWDAKAKREGTLP